MPYDEIDETELLANWFVDTESEESDEIDASKFVLPAHPTHHKPGSAGKVAVLRRRLELGEEFWHPSDEQDLIKTPGFLKFVAPTVPKPDVKVVTYVFDWLKAADEIVQRRDQSAEVVTIGDDITPLGHIYKNNYPYFQDIMCLSGTAEYGIRFSNGDIVLCSQLADVSPWTSASVWPLSALMRLKPA